MFDHSEPVPDETARPKRDIAFIALEPRFLRRSIFLVLIGVLIFQMVTWSFSLLAGFFFNLLLAWLLAISIDPIVTGLAERGMRRGLATSIVAIAGVALVGGFIALFGGALATQITELITAMPGLILTWFGGLIQRLMQTSIQLKLPQTSTSPPIK